MADDKPAFQEEHLTEKADKLEVEDGGSQALSPAEKRLVRKIDLRVLPFLCALYALSLIDRSSISAAKIVGMAVDLNLTGNKYNIALLVASKAKFTPPQSTNDLSFSSHTCSRRSRPTPLFVR